MATVEPIYASMNPDEMISGGLFDDFTGKIVSMEFGAATYPSGDQAGIYFLAVLVKIKPAADSAITEEYVTDMLRAGDLKRFVPSVLGSGKPSGATVEEYEAMAEGKLDEDPTEDELSKMRATAVMWVGPDKTPVEKRALANNSKWAFWINKLIEAEFPKELIQGSRTCDFAVGGTYHFNQVSYGKVKAKKGDKNQNDKEPECLVVTEVIELPPAKDKASGTAAAKPASKPNATPASAEEETTDETTTAASGSREDFEQEVINTTCKVAKEQFNGKTQLPALRSATLKKYTSPKTKSQALDFLNDLKWVEGVDEWIWDGEEGTVQVI